MLFKMKVSVILANFSVFLGFCHVYMFLNLFNFFSLSPINLSRIITSTRLSQETLPDTPERKLSASLFPQGLCLLYRSIIRRCVQLEGKGLFYWWNATYWTPCTGKEINIGDFRQMNKSTHLVLLEYKFLTLVPQACAFQNGSPYHRAVEM